MLRAISALPLSWMEPPWALMVSNWGWWYCSIWGLKMWNRFRRCYMPSVLIDRKMQRDVIAVEWWSESKRQAQFTSERPLLIKQAQASCRRVIKQRRGR